jgi:antitoxin (DNA-binding transcriptional repressor) of toxin-antitoxin stability system
MRIGIKEFRNNISKYLKELPIILTKDGKDIAEIISVHQDQSVHPKDKKLSKVCTPSNAFTLCPKHSVYKNTCGCK